MNAPLVSQASKLRDFSMSPLVVIWEVTRACALRCVHCRAEAQTHRNPLELNTEDGKQLIRQIAEFDSPTFVITGGDPLERPDLFELLEYAVKNGVHTSLAPSVTPLMTRDVLKRLKEIGVSRVSLSLDGADEEHHDGFRQVPGTFRKTMELLRAMRELDLDVQINTTVSRQTLSQVHGIANIAEKMGAKLWSVFFLVPTGRALSDQMISPREHEQVMRWLAKYASKAPFMIKTTEGQPYRRIRIQQQLGAKAHDLDAVSTVLEKTPTGVADGRGFVFISNVGKVYPSGFLPIEVGDVRNESLVAIYRESAILQELRTPSHLKGKCGSCEYNNVCGGSRARAYAVTGDYMQSDPSCPYQPLAMRRGRK